VAQAGLSGKTGSEFCHRPSGLLSFRHAISQRDGTLLTHITSHGTPHQYPTAHTCLTCRPYRLFCYLPGSSLPEPQGRGLTQGDYCPVDYVDPATIHLLSMGLHHLYACREERCHASDRRSHCAVRWEVPRKSLGLGGIRKVPLNGHIDTECRGFHTLRAYLRDHKS